MKASYKSRVLNELARSRFSKIEGNFDRLQLGDEPAPAKPVIQECLEEAAKFFRVDKSFWKRLKAFSPLIKVTKYYVFPQMYFQEYAKSQINCGEYLFGRLEDDRSREILIKLMAFRELGHRHVKLPRNNEAYWKGINDAASTRTDAHVLKIKFMDASLAAYDLKPLGYDANIYASAPGIACAVIQKQYEYHHEDIHCKAERGDVVIDAGCCWGDTTIYFAHEVGSDGLVMGFEFIPSNLAVLKENTSRNPHLASHIMIVENPLWSEPSLKLYYVDWGPGSRVTSDINKYHSWEGVVTTTTIDEQVKEKNVGQVDFIKMDIEGAELNTLRGAEASIRRFRPKMAISLYHSPEDFDSIPRYIDSLELGYRFYLDHHTIYENETVLFAVPQSRLTEL